MTLATTVAITDVRFVRFPNGKVWIVDKENFVSAFCRIDLSDIGDLEAFLDAIADATIGNCMLEDFSYTVIAQRDNELTFEVQGSVESFLAEASDDEAVQATFDDHIDCLASFFSWTPEERRHAENDPAFDIDECVVPLANGRQLRSPAFPAPCDYLRITCAGLEIAYWDHAEWRDDPQVVMGAIMGCAHGAST